MRKGVSNDLINATPDVLLVPEIVDDVPPVTLIAIDPTCYKKDDKLR